MLGPSKWTSEKSIQYNYIPKLPKPISWFLGYRDSPRKPAPLWVKYISILLTTMAGMLVNLAVAERAPLYKNHWHFAEFIPSFAASCILIYGSIEAPFSQPRNLFLGHFVSGLIGVCIMKLFMTNANNEQYLWLSGSLSVAVASLIMDYTGTVHPPSGATAVLPSANTAIRKLGWNYLPALLIQSVLFLAIAVLGNNIVRKYPAYWIAPPAPVPTSKEQLAKPLEIKITESAINLPDEIFFDEEDREFLKSLQAKLMTP